MELVENPSSLPLSKYSTSSIPCSFQKRTMHPPSHLCFPSPPMWSRLQPPTPGDRGRQQRGRARPRSFFPSVGRSSACAPRWLPGGNANCSDSRSKIQRGRISPARAAWKRWMPQLCKRRIRYPESLRCSTESSTSLTSTSSALRTPREVAITQKV